MNNSERVYAQRVDLTGVVAFAGQSKAYQQVVGQQSGRVKLIDFMDILVTDIKHHCLDQHHRSI